jgi:sulfate transport system ATP-binding protein
MKIVLDQVEKTFDTFRAVRGVSLEVGSGELVALLGPSGSGKTTILRMVAGLEYADGGRILFGDQDATDIPVRERGVGFVFQHYALFPHMSVAENIAFGMKVSRRKRSKAEIEVRVADLLRLMQLNGLGNRFPAQISGGQRQRVALARALAVDPRVLLLDEPFGALDANVRRDLRRWLREIHEELGITTLFVTHDQEEALDLADRVVILDQGKIVQEGTPETVCRDPKSAFVPASLVTPTGFRRRCAAASPNSGGASVPARGVEDGAAEVYARPGDLDWSPTGPGIACDHHACPRSAWRTSRHGDHGRKRTSEFDVEPELAIRAGEQGFVTLRAGAGVCCRVGEIRKKAGGSIRRPFCIARGRLSSSG